MVLSRRERYFAVVTLTIILIFMADRLAVSPWLAYRRGVRKETELWLDHLERARIVIARHHQLAGEWESIQGRILHTNQAAAESQALHATRDWAREAGLTVSSIRPERMIEHPQLQEVIFQLSAQGGIKQVVDFLVRLESSNLPLRVVEMQLAPRTEGRDELLLQLKMSTIFMVPEKV